MWGHEVDTAVYPIDFKVVGDFLVSLASSSHNKDAPHMAKAAIRHFHGQQKDQGCTQVCEEDFL